MKLSISIEEHFARSAMLHSRLCPRQVIGVRMARLACRWLGIDPQLDRNQIFVYMEIGRCAADAVIAVTGASPTNGLMQLVSYGKVAATFVNLRTEAAIRVSEQPTSRTLAVQMMPPSLSSWEAQLCAYQIMPDEDLLCWQPVTLREKLPHIPDKHSVLCDRCGDNIGEHCEVLRHGEVLCHPCANGAYYAVQSECVATAPDYIENLTRQALGSGR